VAPAETGSTASRPEDRGKDGPMRIGLTSIYVDDQD
jgi:hypothetical protein